MAYAKDYFGHDTPKLGFGLMRLPKLEDGSMDIPQICDMVDCFMNAGLTYFDTAYVYDDGASEIATRKALVERYPRDAFTITTKANAWLGDPTEEQVKAQLNTSMERLGVDYLDYYLLHAIQDNNQEMYDNYGLWDWIRGLKEQGVIRHWGFSFHAGPDRLERLLNEYPDIDFIQLQINYADMEDPSVQARANYEVAAAHGVPFTVMEPIKGGTLASPIPSIREIFDAANPNASYASWAIRYVASMEGVLTVLSGMSTLAQVQDNVSYMRDFKPLSADEQDVIKRVQEALSQIDSIKCTACHYCTEGCPMGIPIPDFFEDMNELLVFGDEAKAKRHYKEDAEDEDVWASQCIQCGQCEAACPQRLPIIEYLQQVAEALE
ncbi:MAG: aldo/keto reductase [Coriobacteriales bacterium]|nr:aldo/keto reductase [Coriobacteriales bacterium]